MRQEMNNNPSRAIYICKNIEVPNMIKIGISSDICRRINMIETTTGFRMNLEYNTPGLYNASELEKKIHVKFEEYRKRGEWFSISNISMIIEYVDNLVSNQGKIESISQQYMNGKTIAFIAFYHQVTRQAILDKLRGFNIYKNTHKKDIIKDNSFIEEICDVPIQYQNPNFYKTRLGTCLYTYILPNTNNQYYKVEKWLDGTLKSWYFTNLENAKIKRDSLINTT